MRGGGVGGWEGNSNDAYNAFSIWAALADAIQGQDPVLNCLQRVSGKGRVPALQTMPKGVVQMLICACWPPLCDPWKVWWCKAGVDSATSS